MFYRASVSFILSSLIVAGLGTAVRATTVVPDNVALFEMIKALQAKVATLEEELERTRRVARETGAVTNVELPPHVTAFAPEPQVKQDGQQKVRNTGIPVYPSVAKAPPVAFPALPVGAEQWSGAYWGASFGGAMTQGQVISSEKYTAASPDFILGNAIQGVTNPTRNAGGTLDVFLGVNAQIGPYFVAGIQLEGSLANLDFNSEGTRSYSYFDQNGPTGTSAVGDFRPHVHSSWMVSALARAGVLLDPFTLVYATGGWTFANFEYSDLTNNTFFEPGERFWANGINLGGGIERKLTPNWSIRAEYRHTHFVDANVTNNFVFSTSPFPSTQTNVIQTRFANDMHVGRLGVAYLLPTGW